jgi:ammonia channel protein AmtB
MVEKTQEQTLIEMKEDIETFTTEFFGKYNITAKTLESILEKDSKSKFDNIKMQVIDDRNKVIYILLDNGLILPTIPSGSISERVDIRVYFFFVVFMAGIIYPFPVAWGWGGGWL